jgi:tRNA pseudouridine55 synthase
VNPVSRVVLVDKPIGPTSFDVVRRARQGVAARVGHAGTLDPFASGLLLVLIGQATRLSGLLLGLPKEYLLTVKFGVISSTGDPTGVLTCTGKYVDARSVVAALDRFRGRMRQRVPVTSAVKVGGERLYKKAHRGERAETPEREVMIYESSLLDFDERAQTATILAFTGSGTYLRVLAQDLGDETGAGGYALALRRTRIGGFCVGDALPIDDLSVERYEQLGLGIYDLDGALARLPRHELDHSRMRMAANGSLMPSAVEGRFRVYGEGRLIGVYEGRDGVARPVLIFSQGT